MMDDHDKSQEQLIVELTALRRELAERKTQDREGEERLREQTETLEKVNRIGQMLSAELDLHKLVQAVTDAATELSGAQFGAFFYNVLDQRGESYTLYTISGAPHEAFARFPMPRNTALFGPTFRGEDVIRIDDAHLDTRFGKNAPYFGMPPGHLPVTSYLAVPVIGRSGEVMGGLFFGHSQPGMFTEREEQIVVGLAAQAAIAVDNARLFEAVNRERAQAEASEQNYRFLAETIPQIVWTARPDGWVDYFNQRWLDYTGLTQEQSHGWGWQIVLHPDDREYCADAWTSAMATGETYEVEYRLNRASDASYRWHLGRAEPLRDSAGQIVKWFGTCTDIDDRKRAEDGLRFLAEASKVLASSLDYQSTLASLARLAVPALADWCSIDIVEEGQGIDWVEIVHSDPAKAERARELRQRYPASLDAHYGVPRVLRTGQPEVYDDVRRSLVAAGGFAFDYLAILDEWNITSCMIVPLIARQKVLGALTFTLAESGRRFAPSDLALAQELASRTALAIENARLYREAQRAIHARDQFLSIASHELKTPLTSLLGYADLIRRRSARAGLLPERDQRGLQVIAEQASRLNKLILALLDLSRIETGQLSIDRAPLDLVALARRLVDETQPTLDQHTLSFLAPDVPLIIEGDELRLEQVIQNLIQNAVKYSPLGGTITVEVARHGAQAHLRVTDQGIGIPESALPHLFQRFYRAQNADPRHVSGLGIGLYVVKEIVALHGGSVDVVSREGESSAFTISLPCAAEHVRLHDRNGREEPNAMNQELPDS